MHSNALNLCKSQISFYILLEFPFEKKKKKNETNSRNQCLKREKKMNREIIERNKKKVIKGERERKSNTSISRKKIVC